MSRARHSSNSFWHPWIGNLISICYLRMHIGFFQGCTCAFQTAHTHKRASKPTCCHSYLEDILWCDKCPMWGLHGNQLERVKIPIAGCPHAAWPWPGLPWLATETACSRVEHLAWGWAPLFSWDRMMAHCQKLLPNYILWGAKKRKSWLVALATLKHSTRNQSPKSNRKLRQQRVEHTQLDAALCELSDNFRAETLPEKGLLDHGHVPGRSKLHFQNFECKIQKLGVLQHWACFAKATVLSSNERSLDGAGSALSASQTSWPTPPHPLHTRNIRHLFILSLWKWPALPSRIIFLCAKGHWENKNS